MCIDRAISQLKICETICWIRCRIRWTAINFHFVSDGDEDEDEIVDDDALSQPREEPASLEDLPSDQFDMPKRETSV